MTVKQFVRVALSLTAIQLASASYFRYETDHLTADNIEEVLGQRLPKQSRFLGSNACADYLATFNFSTIDVTTGLGPFSNVSMETRDCKAFPGDADWPSESLWTGLELLTENDLVRAPPMAHVCYANGTSSASESTCASFTDDWNIARFISNDPIEVMSPHEIGLTCQPPSLLDTQGCTQGGYPLYTVKASTVSQIQLAVNFARNTGIRFVIKNTGHDFLGKSSGAGSLSVWMHGMKEMEYISSYNGSDWQGAAVKAGAGVQGFELYDFAYQNNATTIGGLCVTVGVTGGWFQGGGHSPLSPLIGMGADQILSLEVVTSDGRFVTASGNQNSDLFWALCGGGAGTYGVVTSVVLKAYPTVPATTAKWSFSYPSNVTEDTFKKAMRAWLSYFPRYAEMGLYSYLNVVPAPDGGRSFVMDPLVAPNKTLDETQAIIQPWLDDVADLGIDFQPDWNHFDDFKGVADNALTNGSANNYGSVSGNRLFPRGNFEGKLFEATFEAIWKNVQEGYVVLPYNMAPAYDRNNPPKNAINPAWREAIAYVIMGTTIDYTQDPDMIMESRLKFSNGPMQRFRDVSLGSGSYGNEGDRLEPNFQWAYFGSAYPRLLELKKRYDPFDLFYAVTAVGSEFYEVRSVDGIANENGRLCRTPEPLLYKVERPE